MLLAQVSPRRGWVLAAMVVCSLGAACTSVPGPARPEAMVSPPSSGAARPAWVDSPGDGVSASAGYHVKGEQAQQELAVARAREEFAKRHGVSISSEQEIRQSGNGAAVAVSTDKQVRETMRDNPARAVVREKWRDPATGALWVWLVPAP